MAGEEKRVNFTLGQGQLTLTAKTPIDGEAFASMAMIDVLSNGRLECGFVRGVPYEASAANITAFRGSEKLWEAHDLILKAWTTHDGPFNFEGRWFHHRQVNVWPRPLQQPHPPVWITVGSGPSTVPVAGHKHVGAVFLAGYGGIRKIFDAYRAAYLAAHQVAAPLDRLAYCALIYVADTPDLARDGAQKADVVHAFQQGSDPISEPTGLSSACHFGTDAAWQCPQAQRSNPR